MRNHLFRGKRIDNHEWIYGYHVKSNSKHFIYCEEEDNFTQTGNWLASYEVDGNTVDEWTEINDKNNKPIFENDIIKNTDQNGNISLFGFVRFSTDCYDGISGFYVDEGTMNEQNLCNENGFYHLVEVVGNIHDNPELIKEKTNE